MAKEKAILVDTTKCTACRACQVACKQWNQRSFEKTKNTGSYQNPPSLGSQTWTRILFNEHYSDGKMSWLFARHQCMHCTDAACVEVCPPNATVHEEISLDGGAVVSRVATNANKCIGCNYCRVACPFEVPGYNQKEKGIFRCTLCADRVSNGLIPACVKVCAPGALQFGNREEIVLKAEARVAALQKAGNSEARVFGKTELGGLKYVYVMAQAPSAYGLPDDPSVPLSVKAWKVLTKPYGLVAAAGLVAAMVVNGVINARNRGLEAKYKLEE